MLGEKKTYLSLIKLGIGHLGDFISDEIDWKTIHDLASQQGLLAVVMDGIDILPAKKRPPKEIMLQWIGDVLQGYEHYFETYRRVIVELANFYNSHGLKMMVLKGYACSLDWPKPEHRPCGDIDIWLFGKQKEGDSLLESENRIQVDKSHHHHTVFHWGNFMVENHYDFVNVYAHKSSADLEKIFKKLGANDSYYVELYGEKVYIPSPNLHALFLIRHMVSHFASSEISLRQVLDWAFFAEKHTNDIDWAWLLGVLGEYHMIDFFNLINAISVDDLGFAADIFPEVRIIPELKERVLQDILAPAYGAAEPGRFFPRIAYKYRRWQGNAWKQKLCYSESRWSAFWRGLLSHIIKPAFT